MVFKNWNYLGHFYDTVLHVEFIQFNQYLGKSLDAFLRYAQENTLTRKEVERRITCKNDFRIRLNATPCQYGARCYNLAPGLHGCPYVHLE